MCSRCDAVAVAGPHRLPVTIRAGSCRLVPRLDDRERASEPEPPQVRASRRVAAAGRRLQSPSLQDPHSSVAARDQSSAVQRPHHDGDGRPPHAEHHRETLLFDRKVVGVEPIPGLERPAATPLRRHDPASASSLKHAAIRKVDPGDPRARLLQRFANRHRRHLQLRANAPVVAVWQRRQQAVAQRGTVAKERASGIVSAFASASPLNSLSRRRFDETGGGAMPVRAQHRKAGSQAYHGAAAAP
jgi:hypothetical protein